MHRVKRFLKTGLKLAAISGVSATVLGFGYLQYINTVLGPINLEKQQAMKYYKQKYQMEQSKAQMTYYFALWNLSLSRIINYQNYLWYCDKFNRKIVNYSLENYQNARILQQVEKAGPIKRNKSAHQKIFKSVGTIRKKNNQNLEDRQFLIKGIFDYQKELNTSEIPSVPQQSKQKIHKLHSYLIEVGSELKDPEILQKLSKLAHYEKKFPKDFVHKVLLI